MTGVWAFAALWVGLALIATLLSIWLRISTALSEIIVIEAPTIVLAVGFDRDSNVRRPIFGVRS